MGEAMADGVCGRSKRRRVEPSYAALAGGYASGDSDFGGMAAAQAASETDVAAPHQDGPATHSREPQAASAAPDLERRGSSAPGVTRGLTMSDRIEAHQRTTAAVNLVHSVSTKGRRRVDEQLKIVQALREQHLSMCRCVDGAAGTSHVPTTNGLYRPLEISDVSEDGSTPVQHSRACDWVTLDYGLREAWLTYCSCACLRIDGRQVWHKPDGPQYDALPVPPSHTVRCLLARREFCALDEGRAHPTVRDTVARIATLLKIDKAIASNHPYFLPRPNVPSSWAHLETIVQGGNPLARILLYIGTPREIATAAAVCKNWRAVATASSLWLPLLKRYFGATEAAALGDTDPRDHFAALWGIRARRLAQKRTRSIALKVPPDETVTAVCLGSQLSPTLLCLGTVNRVADNAFRLSMWTLSGSGRVDGEPVAPTHGWELDAEHGPALAIGLLDADPKKHVVTLHRDCINVWSLDGERTSSVPCRTVEADADTVLLRVRDRMMYYCNKGNIEVQVTCLDRQDTSTISTEGPVHCLEVSTTHVVVATTGVPSRGTLTAHNTVKGTSTSTWLPPDRHVTHAVCAGNFVVTSDSSSAICVWKLVDMAAPVYALNVGATLDRLRPRPQLPRLLFSAAAVRRMASVPATVRDITLLPTGVVMLTGGTSDNADAWTATIELAVGGIEIGCGRIKFAAGRPGGTLLDANLRWSATTLRNGAIMCQDYAPPL
mmetsp:Transcript_13208/g.39739  ORF Transcript_13208/g.39739 Transcript_13208/m.39739 type:complete len:719 (-) Transcript_13208:1295-3451(-)